MLLINTKNTTLDVTEGRLVTLKYGYIPVKKDFASLLKLGVLPVLTALSLFML